MRCNEIKTCIFILDPVFGFSDNSRLIPTGDKTKKLKKHKNKDDFDELKLVLNFFFM